MQGKNVFRLLLLLLALFSLAHADIFARFPGAGAGSGSGAKGGSSPKGTGPKGTRPQRPGTRPRPSLAALGVGGVIVGASLEGADDAKQEAFKYDLGSYSEDQQPFAENTGEMQHFYSKVYDFFAASDTFVQSQVAAEPTPNSGPFSKDGRPDGEPVTATRTATAGGEDEPVHSVFDPAKPTDVCIAWSSLDQYCNGGNTDIDTSCICYSSTYYVPRMWNSLAAGCASITSSCDDDDDSTECSVRSAALDARTYCATESSDYDDPDSTSAVKFAYYDDAAPTDSASGGSGGGGGGDSPDATAGQGAGSPNTPDPTSTETSTDTPASTAQVTPNYNSGPTVAPKALTDGATTSVSGLGNVVWTNSHFEPVSTGTTSTTGTSRAAGRLASGIKLLAAVAMPMGLISSLLALL